MANGSADAVVIGKGAPLAIAVTLSPGSYDKMPVDYWMLMRSPGGPDAWHSYTVRDSAWLPGKTVAHQGKCHPVTVPFAISVPQNLPEGTHQFFFGIDTVKNGDLDMESLSYDSVQVSIR